MLLELTLGPGIRGILERAFASRLLGLTRAVVHSGVGPFLGSPRGFGLGLCIEELSVIGGLHLLGRVEGLGRFWLLA